MGGDVRKEAQKRVDRIASFREELDDLAREGGLILTPEQQSGLDAHLNSILSKLQQHYGVDASESARRVSWGMRTVSLLGVAALLAAGILFVHQVWGHLSTLFQVVVLTIAPLVLLFGAEIAYRRRADLYYVGLLALAAGVAFVTEINALGAIFNLTNSPVVLPVWGCFALLVAYAYGLRLLLGAGLVLVGVGSGAILLHIQGYYWVEFMQSAQLLIPGAVIMYCIPWVVRRRGPDGFDRVYRLSGAGVGLLSLFLLSIAGDLCCGAIAPGTIAATYQVLGLLTGVAVLAHGLRLGHAVLVYVGAAAFVIFLYARLHSWWWNWMPKYLFCLLLAVVAFGLLLVFRRIRSRITGRVTG